MTPILIAGELNADMVMSGLPSLPIFGRELVGNDFQIVMGSSSAITAARLAQLGAEVDFSGIVGDDSLGEFVMGELGNFGVGTTNISKVSERTGVTIALTYSQDRALLTFPGTIETYTGDNITSELLANYSHLHVGSFFLQTALQPNLAQIFQQAHVLGLTTSLDVGWDPNEEWSENPYLYSTLEHVDFFIPNQDEANAILGENQQVTTLAERVHGILIIKQGKDGATAYNQNGEIARVSSLSVDVVDTTGAGDAFNAGFIFAHKVDKLPIGIAMQFASACGAQAVTNVGGASNAPHADRIRDMIYQSN
jgi:sugar/nucleoside kinase (ribokinase family)